MTKTCRKHGDLVNKANRSLDLLPEPVALSLVVNKALSQISGHHKLQPGTGWLFIVHRVDLNESETTA